MGLTPSTCCTCEDCPEPLHFASEEDLDHHQLSIHWCLECVAVDQQDQPFLSYEHKQNHVSCECSSTAKLAGRTRGMSTYDSSTSQAIRKRFLPESFEGHHIVGLSSDAIHHTMSNERLTFQGGQTDSSASHHYYFDVAVPGRVIDGYTPGDVMGAAVTCCFEAALQLLSNQSVTTDLCDGIIQQAIVEDGAEHSHSISSIYMHDRLVKSFIFVVLCLDF